MACVALLVMVLLAAVPLHAQPGAALQGHVFDASGAVLRGATVNVNNRSTAFDRAVATDDEGRYLIQAIPSGAYDVTASAPGFKSAIVAALYFDVGRTLVRDFRLEIGDTSETVVVTSGLPLVDRASATVGHVVTAQTVHEIPLNGRHFTDLGLLVPGSVAPSQTGFSTTPFRGIGALAFNTAGNREEAVAFVINGVTTNNLSNGSLGYQPAIGSLQEFKVDNSVFSPEFGHVSGAVVNIVTRSGSESFHGDAYEFLRDDALDARNYFEFNSAEPHPFKRHEFGGSLGGPVLRRRLLFFATYEGLRQQQGLDMNSLVLTDQERAAATDPAVRRLIELIPRGNAIDASGTARFVGSASAEVNMNRWTIDFRENAGNGGFHVYYGRQAYRTNEPAASGTTVPGFGFEREPRLSAMTIDHTYVFGPTLLNEARFGLSRLNGTTVPVARFSPAEFGIRNGVERAIGLPQMVVAGGLSFGGPSVAPVGRDDALYVYTDTLALMRGRQSLRLGGEYRHFRERELRRGIGIVQLSDRGGVSVRHSQRVQHHAR